MSKRSKGHHRKLDTRRSGLRHAGILIGHAVIRLSSMPGPWTKMVSQVDSGDLHSQRSDRVRRQRSGPPWGSRKGRE